jgi:uncharacterized protein YyaL (SSP411 family)
VLDAPEYREAAIHAADFILTTMQRDGRLLRSYRAGQAHLMGYVDDYAFFIEGLLGLYEITGELRWLTEAERLTQAAIQYFWDDTEGGFFFTASDHEQLIVRSKGASDNAIPSGNSVMVSNLMKLALLLDRVDYREKAGRILKVYSASAAQSPFAHERLLAGLESWHEGFQEIVIIGPSNDPRTRDLLRTVYSTYIPNKIVALLDLSKTNSAETARRILLLAGKTMVDNQPTAYVCRNYACQAPTSDTRALNTQLT